MKKILIILACCTIINVANASIKGKGVHFDNSEEFLSAFKNCTPYKPNVFDPKNMDKNKIQVTYFFYHYLFLVVFFMFRVFFILFLINFLFSDISINMPF